MGRLVAITVSIFLLGGIAALVPSRPIPVCPDPIGWAYADSCNEAPIVPSLSVGQMTTQCFYYKPYTEYSTLSYIIGDFNCGPFAPYASLTYELYDENCDSLIYSGSIHPTAVNNFIWLDTTLTYRICYTWTALCEQFSACPIINPSLLPLTWLDVTGRYIQSSGFIEVAWVTASEVNCSHFVIEKMLGGQWVEIGQMPAQGNATYTNTYQFTDESPEDYNFYRIRQVDNNGVFSYSKVILVKVKTGKYSDCYYMTMLGEVINDDIYTLPKGIYIKRCIDRFTLITITQ